jgi:hypothetical protein
MFNMENLIENTMSNMLTFDTVELINVIHFIIQLKKVGFELLFIGIN